jgi:hypothetical protein
VLIGNGQSTKKDATYSPRRILRIQEDIKVKLSLVRSSDNNLEVEVIVQNTSENGVYATLHPVRVDGTKGPYLALDENDRNTLLVGSLLYPKPENCVYSAQTRINLVWLGPNTSFVEKLSIAYPFTMTTPPFKDTFMARDIEPGSIKFLKAAIGFLPDEEGTQDYLKHRSTKLTIDASKVVVAKEVARGDEILLTGTFNGKSLLELQTLVYSDPLEIPSLKIN